MNRSLRSVVLLLLGLCLASCSRTPSWLRGTFEFDVDATMRATDGEAKPGDDNSLLGAVKDLARALGPVALTAKYGDTNVSFTDKELVQTKNGTGRAETFDVFDHSSSDVIVIKSAGGEVTTWKRTSTGIAQKVDSLWVHYKRVK